MIRQPTSVFHILAIAASSRMSVPPRSAMSDARSATASMAKISAVIRPIFCAMASCFPIGWPHCTRSAAQRRTISSARLAPATAEAGSVSRPVLRVISASLRPLPSPQRTFSTGTSHVGEADDAVLDRLEPHEVEPLHDFDAGPVGLDDEGRDLLGPGPRHHDHQLGHRAVGAPELLAVQDVVRAVRGQHRAGGHRRGITPDVRLGEREGADGALGEAREVALLLLGGAEDLERLGHADRLRRREQRGQVAVDAGDHADRVGVAGLAQAEPAVLLGNLDAEGAELPEPLDHVGGNLALPVDPIAVDPLDEESLQPLHERPGALHVGGIHGGEGVDELESERALEQLPDEAGCLPLLLAGALGDLARFLLGRELGARRFDGRREDVSHGSRSR